VQARKSALDMGYKLKDRYAAEKHLNMNVEVEALPIIKDLTEKLNQLYGGTSHTETERASSKNST
jgi:hypothetical protein